MKGTGGFSINTLGMRMRWRTLNSSSSAETADKLISDPFASSWRNLKRINQTTSDNENSTTDDHEWLVPSKNSDSTSYDDRRNDDGRKIRDSANTGAFCRGSFDGLEVKGQVEDMCLGMTVTFL
jgi:hypothetical protein